MTTYQVAGFMIESDDSRLGEVLARVYGSSERPLCMCQPAGVPMYISKAHDRYVVKRMPNGGATHGPACESYEPPAELSGLGDVAGSAIREADDGVTSLRLDFTLSMQSARGPMSPASGPGEGSARTDGSKLTLSALLHFLWEQAGFQRWHPSMAGKRSWPVVRKYVLQACEGKVVRGRDLTGVVYLPEPFHVDDKPAIEQRRIARMLQGCAPGAGRSAHRMVLIGEVKEIRPSRYGHKLVVKHLPDFGFMMADDLHKRLLRRFDAELGLWAAEEASHLMVIGTFSLAPSGVASLEEASMMCVTSDWLPFEDQWDLALLQRLEDAGRRFTKCLRYNLPATRPLATAVLLDVAAGPVALYVARPQGDEAQAALDDLIASSSMQAWCWHVGADAMPELPAAG